MTGSLKVIATAVMGGTIFIGGWAPVNTRVHEQAQPSSIVGAWILNKTQSETKRDDMPDANSNRPEGTRDRSGGFGRGGGSFGRSGNMSRGGDSGRNADEVARMRDAIRDITEASERLTIVLANSMVIITTGEGRTIRLSPDGTKIKDESTNIERRSKWDGGKLVTEITGLGPKMTETYVADPERHQLIVILQTENSRVPQGMTMRRVYDADRRSQ